MSIGQANDRAGGGESTPGSPGAGDDDGRQRDEGYVALLRSGDEGAFGLLFDAWADPIFDRISNRGFPTTEATRVESDTFATVHRRMSQQTGQPGSDSFRVMAMRAARQEVAASASNRVDTSLPVGPYAEDRLTRGTDVRALASDPAVAALLWQAAELLGEQVREVLDLTHRHHLTPSEVAAVLQEPPGAIEEILRKVAAGYGAVVRARIVWRQGTPTHDALREQVAGESRFDASMVRRVAEHLRECEECRSASQVPVAPIEVFAAIPIAIAPPGFKEEVAETLESNGVPMVGSTASRRNDAFPDFDDDEFPDFDEDDDERIDRAAIAAALAETAVDDGRSPLGATPGADDPTTVVPAVGDEADAADDDSHPGVAAAAGAAAGAAAVGLAAGLGELPADAATGADAAGATGATAGATMLPGGLGPVPRADFGPDVEPPPKSPVPSTLIAASMRKGGGGGTTPPEDKSGSRNRWIAVAVATVAVIAVLAFMLTHTGSKQKADVSTDQTTTSTTEATTTTEAPTTSLGTATTVKHHAPPPKGSTTTTQTTIKGQTTTTTIRITTTTQAVTTTTNPLFPGLQWNFFFTPTDTIKLHSGLHNGGVPYWDVTQPGAPNVTWSPTADIPISVVLVSGPGFSATTNSGSSAALCPLTPVGTRCQATPGTYQYTLKISDQHGHTISQTIVLSVFAPSS